MTETLLNRCDLGSYADQRPCINRAHYQVYVTSLFDGVTRATDVVCGEHRSAILIVKRGMYLAFKLEVPDMWIKPEGNRS